MTGDQAYVLSKNYTKQSLEGAGALKGKDGFSPIITENPDNTEDVYKLDITNAYGTFTTPDLKGDDGEGASKIDEIKVNGTPLPIALDKSVNIEVPTTAKDIGALPLTGGELSGLLTPNGGIDHAGHNYYIQYPKDGAYHTRNSTVIGYLKIKLPVSWTGTFIKFKVSILNGASNTSVDYIISGYCQSNGNWGYTTAVCLSNAVSPLRNLSVMFGANESNESIIAIGEANTAWSYPQIQISDIVLGWNNIEYSKWKSGWDISVDAKPLLTINTTITNNLPSAQKAEQDGNGNVIATTYAKNNVYAEGKFTGQRAEFKISETGTYLAIALSEEGSAAVLIDFYKASASYYKYISISSNYISITMSSIGSTELVTSINDLNTNGDYSRQKKYLVYKLMSF